MRPAVGGRRGRNQDSPSGPCTGPLNVRKPTSSRSLKRDPNLGSTVGGTKTELNAKRNEEPTGILTKGETTIFLRLGENTHTEKSSKRPGLGPTFGGLFEDF